MLAEIAAARGHELPPMAKPQPLKWQSLLGPLPGAPHRTLSRHRTIDGYHPAGYGTYLGVRGAWVAWTYRDTKMVGGKRKQRESKRRARPAIRKGEPVMDKMKEVKGAAKETVGKAIGDAKTPIAGKTDKAVGMIQNAVGGLKDAAKKP